MFDNWCPYPASVNELNVNISSSVTPNPALDFITINCNQLTNQKYNVIIMDINGKVVKKIIGQQSDETLVDVKSFVPGVYYYKITAADKNVSTGKFVKR